MNFRYSKSGDFCKDYAIATKVKIQALIEQGRNMITLDELYANVNALNNAQKTSVRMAIRVAKDIGDIRKTKIKGVYEVVRY